jgi:hypothetical protein
MIWPEREVDKIVRICRIKGRKIGTEHIGLSHGLADA